MRRGLQPSAMFWVVLLVTILAAAFVYQTQHRRTESWSLTDLVKHVRSGDVAAIEVSGDESRASVKLKNDEETRYIVLKERSTDSFLAQTGLTPADLKGIDYLVAKPSTFGALSPLLTTLVPFALMLGFLVFMMRQAQAGNNQAMAFGRSRARLMTGDTPTVKFEDVAGVEEAKQELVEIVEFLREPDKFIALGAQIPKGVLMMGPPGCGKTLMARAVAGEAGVPFFSISGSEFVEMFVGVGASRVRDLFDQAKKHSPCIVFIDEVDAVGRQRGAGLGGSHDEREQTLNQILVEMDGFNTDTNVIIIAATNRPDILDPALLRPGRFDRRVVIGLPDVKGRKAILEIHAKGKPMATDLDLETVARQSAGFSGADLENLVNEAAILAARRDARVIANQDLQEAAEKVQYGPERRSHMISPRELELIAYHEVGHALVRFMIPDSDPVHKISIIPRGKELGMVTTTREDDHVLLGRRKLLANLTVRLGGRAAEDVIFGDLSTRASDDLERVTKLARDMVTRYGMSDLMGPITFGEKNELVFLGRELSEQRNYSEAVARQIDIEVRRLVTESYERARGLVSANLDRVHAVAKKLLELETMDRQDFEAVMAATG